MIGLIGLLCINRMAERTLSGLKFRAFVSDDFLGDDTLNRNNPAFLNGFLRSFFICHAQQIARWEIIVKINLDKLIIRDNFIHMSNVRLSVMVDLKIRALAKHKAALRMETMPDFITNIVTNARTGTEDDLGPDEMAESIPKQCTRPQCSKGYNIVVASDGYAECPHCLWRYRFVGIPKPQSTKPKRKGEKK